MRHLFYRKRIVAGLLVAILSATSLSTTALADSSTFVEITDEGPLAASAAAGVQNRGAETATTTETAASVNSAGAQVVQGTDAMSTRQTQRTRRRRRTQTVPLWRRPPIRKRLPRSRAHRPSPRRHSRRRITSSSRPRASCGPR